MTALGRASALAILAALGACAAPAPRNTTSGSDAAVPATPVREHERGRFVELVGAKAQHDLPYLGTPGTNFFCLRSFIDRQTGKTADQLYVADSYDGKERDWDAAYDAAGKPLRFIAISRFEITCKYGCSYAEEFAANIPQDELLASPEGFSVTFTDRAGDRKTINVSGAQVGAQLQALAAQQKTGPVPSPE
jgi:hypothetical protein